jgi:RHS repeat-associated protein
MNKINCPSSSNLLITRESSSSFAQMSFDCLRSLFFWLAVAVFGLGASINSARAQMADGDLGWTTAGAAGSFPTAESACRAQWQAYQGTSPKSRFIGAFPTGNPNGAQCSWTSFQYLCPAENVGGPNGINSCGTILPSLVFRTCAAGYTAVLGKYCAKDEDRVPERGCGASNNGAQTNPAVGHPFILSTGCKILHDEDYATADGELEVGRTYRSLPVGASVSARALPLGLASNWAFDFAHEIQLTAPSGTPAAPNLRLALVASDGTAYDYTMQSGGAIIPDISTGAQYAPKNMKVEFVGVLPAALADIPATPSQWKMTDQDETVWTFQTFQTFTSLGLAGNLTGRPISKVTKKNYRWDFAYNSDGALQTITDSFGRQLVFSWHYFYVSALAGQASLPTAVKSIALPDGTSLAYSYDPAPAATAPSTSQIQRLIKVERLSSAQALLRSTSYAYNDVRFGSHITSIARTDGQVVASYSYDSRGRGATSALAGNVQPYAVASATSASDAVRTVTKPLGQVDEYRFQKIANSAQFRLTQVNGQASPTTPASTRTISYGTDNFISSTVDEENRTTNFTRNARGNALSTVEAVGTTAQRTTGVTMHPTLNLPAQVVRTGLTTSYTYDPQGKMLTRTETDTTTHTVPYSTNAQARTSTYNWSASGRLLSINGPKAAVGVQDDVLTFTYSPQGHMLTSTNGLGQITTFAGHDANGRPATMTDPNGVVTAYTYDALGQTTAINVKHPTTAASDAITQIEYDTQGRVIGIKAPSTDKLIMDYDIAGQLMAVRAASGERIDYVRDAMGGVTSETVKRTDATTARSIARTFDALGRMLTETLGPGRTTAWSYDKVGNPTQVVSARNNATQMAFDGLDRLISTAHPGGGSEALAYNPLDDETGFTDAISVTTSFVRNGFGEAIQEVSPDRGTTTYTYNVAGERISEVDGRGQQITYVRDILGRVRSKTPVGRPASEVVTYNYDAGGIGSYQIGRLTTVVDGSGTTAFQYDHRGNMLRKRQAVGTTATASLIYAYDLADRITQITYPSGRIVGYVRDTKGRVVTARTKASSTVTAWTNLATAVQYEPFAALKQATLGNGQSLRVSWGNDGRLASRRLYTTVGGANRSLLTYAYDNDDNITGITDGVTAANSVTYGYDVRGRLAQASLAAASTAPFKRTDYVFDANGNRTAVERRVNAADVSASETDLYTRTAGTNRLASLSTPAGLRSLTPDARGNLTAESRPGGISVAAGYDGHGRLISYTRTGNPNLTHSYNGLDDRVSTTTGTDTRRFVYAPDGRVLGEYGASATDVRAEFIWMNPQVSDGGTFGGDDGVGGYMPLAVVTTGGTLSWVHGDRLGTPILITNAAGAAIAQPSGYTPPAFPGQSKTLADLYYNRHRDYDPTTGRYIQADPIGLAGGASPYSYAMNNPLRYTDPTGEFVPAAVAAYLGRVAIVGIVGTYLWYEWTAHNPYNPMGGHACLLRRNSSDGGGRGVFGNPPRGNDEPEDECEVQFETDIGRCTKARIQYGKNGFAQCASSALRRQIQCEKGQRLEPLTGVDRPLYRD